MNEEFKRKRGGKRATAAAADPDEGSKAAPILPSMRLQPSRPLNPTTAALTASGILQSLLSPLFHHFV